MSSSEKPLGPVAVRAASLVLFLLGTATYASAQCTVASPVRFPSGFSFYPKFFPGYTDSFDVYSAGGSRRLVERENYGYSILDLSNPASPRWLGYFDIEQQSGYQKNGDGFNTVERVAAAADGSRIFVNYKESTHGNLLMQPSGSIFSFAGEYNPARCQGGVAVAHVGSRYLGFSLQPGAGLVVADVTNFVTGSSATHQNSIPSESLSGPEARV